MRLLIRVLKPEYFDETLEAIKGKEGFFNVEKKGQEELWAWFQANIMKARIIPPAIKHSTILQTVLYNFVYASKNAIRIVSSDKEKGEIVYDANTAPTTMESVFMAIGKFPGSKRLTDGVQKMVLEGHAQMWAKARKKEGWPKGILYIDRMDS